MGSLNYLGGHLFDSQDGHPDYWGQGVYKRGYDADKGPNAPEHDDGDKVNEMGMVCMVSRMGRSMDSKVLF